MPDLLLLFFFLFFPNRVLNQRSIHFCYSPSKQILLLVISPIPRIQSSIEVNVCLFIKKKLFLTCLQVISYPKFGLFSFQSYLFMMGCSTFRHGFDLSSCFVSQISCSTLWEHTLCRWSRKWWIKWSLLGTMSIFKCTKLFKKDVCD